MSEKTHIEYILSLNLKLAFLNFLFVPQKFFSNIELLAYKLALKVITDWKVQNMGNNIKMYNH